MSMKLHAVIVGLFVIVFAAISIADVKSDAKITSISAGQNHSLILTQNKFSWGCGYNSYYQLGVGDQNNRWTPVRVHGFNNNGFLGDINDVSAGNIHSLALDANSSVWAWGYNYYGQIGDNSQYVAYTPVLVHGVNNSGYLKNIVAISASQNGEHSLATDSNNLCYAWGFNNKGQLGDGSTVDKLTPIKVHAGEQNPGHPNYDIQDIVSVSAGEDHSMALDANGLVYTWGQNSYDKDGISKGRLGAGNTTADSNNLPVKVHGVNNTGYLENIVAVSAGWNHCMAMEDYNLFDPNYKGRVYTWGWGGSTSYSAGGRLGNGSTTNQPTPVRVKAGEQDPNDLEGIIAIAAGEGHSMFLTAGGQVLCTGDNTSGQLGNNTTTTSTVPVKVLGRDGVGYLNDIVAISAGAWHSLALDRNGTVWAWGRNNTGVYATGRLGLGSSSTITLTPQPVHVVYNLTKQNFCFTIAEAINSADNNNIIEASKGTYFEQVNFPDKHLTLRSTDPNDPTIVAGTAIHIRASAGNDYTVRIINNAGSVLAGFRLTGGTYAPVYCGYSSSVKITNCAISDAVYGIVCKNAGVDITACDVNTPEGIYFNPNSNSDVNITSCNFDCSNDAIHCQHSTINVSDCNIVGGFIGVNSDASMSTVAGSVIRNCSGFGIDSSDSGLNVVDCNISGNGNGIMYNPGHDLYSISIANSIIENNSGNGIKFGCSDYERDLSPEVSIHNNVIRSNYRGIAFYSVVEGTRQGIVANYIEAYITNNLIYDNAEEGIYLWITDMDFNAYIRNNTITKDANGIVLFYEDTGYNPYSGYIPQFPYVDIKNCILWGNSSYDIIRSDCYPERCYTFGVSYSCIEDGYAGETNINTDPCFVNPENDNFHLDPNSRCIDSGNSSGIPDTETDIDSEERVIDGDADGIAVVDMGADEFYWPKADFNHDEIVNFLDYAILAKAWRTASGNPGYNETCDLQNDNHIDCNDLALFCDDWLWQAPWGEGVGEMMMGGEGMSESLVVTEEALLFEPLPEPPASQMTSAEVEQLLNRLTEIWLNNEKFRQGVDYDVLLRLMEHLKKQAE